MKPFFPRLCRLGPSGSVALASLMWLAPGAPLAADTLSLGSDPTAVPPAVPMRLIGPGLVVGMQFDIQCPAAQGTPGEAALESSTSDHRARSTLISPGRRRVIVSSPTNTPIPAALRLSIPVLPGASLPAGGATMEVKSVIFTGSSGETIGSVIALAPLDSWRQAYFNPAEREDPALISDSVDPDGDGLSNLAEYVAGLNPRSPDAPSPSGRAGLPRNDSDGTASPPILRLLWTGPSPGLPGVTTGAEEGPDLQTWTPVPIIVDSTIAGTISLRAESTPITDAHRFLRLSIQRSAVSP